jgi:DNA ligase (NAD+)
VEDIELNIGKTGRLSLRARIIPVEVDGSVVTYASLHNVGWLQAADIRIGSKVVVFKANDIIPQVRLAPGHEHPEDSTPWAAPVACPQCGESFDKSTELWRCTSPECSVVGRIIYGASRDAGFDIEGLGSVVAEALVEAGLAKDIADLFALTESQLANLPLGGSRTLGALNAAKIMAQIELAKSAPLAKVITSLSMRHTGRTFGRRLAAHFKTMAALRAATVSQLANVEGIGDGKAATIHAGLAANADILDRMAAAGVNMGEEAAEGAEAAGSTVLAGEIVVVTGSMKSEPTLSGLARDAMNTLIEAHGGKSSGSVSAKTTLLVCGEPGSSKWTKATELGIEILTPVDFAKKLGLK